MINWDKSKKNKLYILIFLLLLVVLVIVAYSIIISKKVKELDYVSNLEEIVSKNDETVFSIEKLYLCSSANAIYNTSKNITDLEIYQYTDIAVYINNYQDENGLTNTNTIKELYIDNIEIDVDENEGNQYLNYTNSLVIGSKEIVPKFTQTDRIDFNIVYTNEEKEDADYDDPTFYTDCSDPITLRYVNSLGTDYSLNEDSESSFDGSILEDANISVEYLDCKIKFKVNIVNNDGEYFSCWINFSLPLSDIYDGTTIKTASFSGYLYDFFAA